MNTKKKEKDIEALRQRIYCFVVQVVNLVKELPNTLIGNRIGGQLLDAGTSIGVEITQARLCQIFKALGIRWNRGKLKVTSPDPLYRKPLASVNSQ